MAIESDRFYLDFTINNINDKTDIVFCDMYDFLTFYKISGSSNTYDLMLNFNDFGGKPDYTDVWWIRNINAATGDYVFFEGPRMSCWIYLRCTNFIGQSRYVLSNCKWSDRLI